MRRILILAITVLATGAFKCSESDIERVGKGPNGSVLTTRKTAQRSPAGLNVFSENGMTAAQLVAIDGGFADARSAAEESDYTAGFDPQNYEVLTPPYECTLSPVQRIPSFLVRGDVYDGSMYDVHFKDGEKYDPPKVKPCSGGPPGCTRTYYSEPDGRGVIYAAEMILQMGAGMSQRMYVCPNPSSVRTAVRNGSEHILIGLNDSTYFLATYIHGPPHPLLPKPDDPLFSPWDLTGEYGVPKRIITPVQ